MLPKQHILINLIISILLLFFIKPVYVLIFFLTSVFIDIDHYLYYIVEEKDFSLKKAYKWFLVKREKMLLFSKEERKKHLSGFLIFHGFEPFLILFLLSKFYYPLMFISLGLLAHLAQDLLIEVPLGVAKLKFSVTYALYKHFQKLRSAR